MKKRNFFLIQSENQKKVFNIDDSYFIAASHTEFVWHICIILYVSTIRMHWHIRTFDDEDLFCTVVYPVAIIIICATEKQLNHYKEAGWLRND